VPLFEGIISDLFPGVGIPEPDFGVFLEALKENIIKRKLQPVPWFIHKIIQVNVCFKITQVDFSVTIYVLSSGKLFSLR